MTEFKGIDVDALQSAIDEMQKMQAKIKEYYAEAFKATCKHLFETYPTLESFGWTQFTPYFNDGDSCEFGVCTDEWYMRINGECPEESEEWDYDSERSGWYSRATGEKIEYKDVRQDRKSYVYNTGVFHKTDEKLTEALRTVQAFINAMDEDSLKAMFGDHAQVIVTSEKVETEHFDHD